MKKNILISLIFLILAQCKDRLVILQNGKYKVEFTGNFSVAPSYQIEVQDSLFIEMAPSGNKTYGIGWKSDDIFQVRQIPTENYLIKDPNTLSPSKFPYYQITETIKDSIFFDYYQGGGISTVTGKFIRN